VGSDVKLSTQEPGHMAIIGCYDEGCMERLLLPGGQTAGILME